MNENQDEVLCPYCLRTVVPLDDIPHEWYICQKHGEIPTEETLLALLQKGEIIKSRSD